MIKTFFVNSTLAKYDDADFAWLQSLVLNAGVLANSAGTLGLAVTQNASPGMSVQVAIGKALVQITKSTRTFKVVVDNDAVVTVPISSNSSGVNRVDAIVVRVNVTTEPAILKDNIGTIERVLGTGATALSDGAITTALGSDGWIRIANVTVANGAVSILNASIADVRTKVTTNNAITVKDNVIDTSLFATAKFGGDGSDGPLAVSSGVQNIDLGGAALVIKNWSSVAITGTGKVTFTNPHANGTFIIFKVKGDFTLTSSTVPNIDAKGMGAAAQNFGASNIGFVVGAGQGGQAANPNVGGSGGIKMLPSTPIAYNIGAPLACGSGGGNGAGNNGFWLGGGGGGGASKLTDGSSGTGGTFGNSTSTAASGGRGGPVFVVECAGNWNTTGAIAVDGLAGQNATSNPGSAGGGGGGGEIYGRYKTLITNTATNTFAGGIGGTGLGGGFAGGNGANGSQDIRQNTERV